jgi:hypothetical protein
LTALIVLHIILVALNGIIAGIWLGQRNIGLGLLHIFLMALWGFLLYMDFAH